jgi:hypothetical protein
MGAFGKAQRSCHDFGRVDLLGHNAEAIIISRRAERLAFDSNPRDLRNQRGDGGVVAAVGPTSFASSIVPSSMSAPQRTPASAHPAHQDTISVM